VRRRWAGVDLTRRQAGQDAAARWCALDRLVPARNHDTACIPADTAARGTRQTFGILRTVVALSPTSCRHLGPRHGPVPDERGPATTRSATWPRMGCRAQADSCCFRSACSAAHTAPATSGSAMCRARCGTGIAACRAAFVPRCNVHAVAFLAALDLLQRLARGYFYEGGLAQRLATNVAPCQAHPLCARARKHAQSPTHRPTRPPAPTTPTTHPPVDPPTHLRTWSRRAEANEAGAAPKLSVRCRGAEAGVLNRGTLSLSTGTSPFSHVRSANLTPARMLDTPSPSRNTQTPLADQALFIPLLPVPGQVRFQGPGGWHGSESESAVPTGRPESTVTHWQARSRSDSDVHTPVVLCPQWKGRQGPGGRLPSDRACPLRPLNVPWTR
jgi:hypothetical protein